MTHGSAGTLRKLEKLHAATEERRQAAHDAAERAREQLLAETPTHEAEGRGNGGAAA